MQIPVVPELYGSTERSFGLVFSLNSELSDKFKPKKQQTINLQCLMLNFELFDFTHRLCSLIH